MSQTGLRKPDLGRDGWEDKTFQEVVRIINRSRGHLRAVVFECAFSHSARYSGPGARAWP